MNAKPNFTPLIIHNGAGKAFKLRKIKAKNANMKNAIGGAE